MELFGTKKKNIRINFWYLTAFTQKGGIETFNRTFIKALANIQVIKPYSIRIFSVYDKNPDRRYISNLKWKGYGGHRIRFVIRALWQGLKCDVLIVGHIHLAPIAIILKWLNPNCKILLIAHGIEVWKPSDKYQKKLLQKARLVLAVSNFTRSRLIEQQHLPAERIQIFPNCIDPYFPLPNSSKIMPSDLLKKHRLKANQKIILSVCRLSSKEQYKGYDRVIEALPFVTDKFADVVYILVGQYDTQELNRLLQLAEKFQISDRLIITGFVSDNELAAYYQLADLFILPSSGEGFGVVFLEALAYGLPIIAYDSGGVRDALNGAKKCILLKSLHADTIAEACIRLLNENAEKCIDVKFTFDDFQGRLMNILSKVESEVRQE